MAIYERRAKRLHERQESLTEWDTKIQTVFKTVTKYINKTMQAE
jgi:hypothetical protein